MKKLITLILILTLLGVSALAAEVGSRLKVVNCDEYITLREEPSTSASALARMPLGAAVDMLGRAKDGFWHVSYEGQSGYALSKYLREVEDYTGDPVDVSREERYNINLFLSNFTEQGFMWSSCYDSRAIDWASVTEFALNHCWFNRQNRLEWGEYFGDNNVRLSEEQVPPVVEKFFGLDITPSQRLQYIDYKGGYYYWEETGGHVKDGFACLTRVEKLGERYYSVWFEVYGRGEDWTNDVCYYTDSQAYKAYPPYEYPPMGHAVIEVGSGGLADRSGWSIQRYTVNYD